jgi:hypothetical protein
MLRFSVPRGRDLDETTLRAMYELRARLMNLKPEVDRDADFASFSRVCRSADRALLFKNGPRLVGMTIGLLHRYERDGQRRVTALAEYIQIEREVRGSLLATAGFLAMLALVLRPLDLRARWFAGGVGYPASVLFGARLGAKIWIDGDADAPPEVIETFAWFADKMSAKRDPVTRHVVMATRPPPLHPRLLDHPEYAHYVARNDRWQEGIGVAAFADFSSGVALVRGLVAMGGRRARR